MAWQDVADTMLRALVNDLSSTTYDDNTLEQILVVAAFQVGIEMKFNFTYTADISNVGISPDPTAPATTDISFINMMCLKAACILDRGGAVTAASQAIKVKDGASSIDLEGIFKGKYALLQKGWCAVYDDAKLEYMSGQSRLAGAAVLTPFRVFPDGAGFFTTIPGRGRDYYW